MAVRLLARPGAALPELLSMIRAHRDLRHCDKVGQLPRLYGRCWVMQQGGAIEIGDRLLVEARMARCSLNVHDGGRLLIGSSVYLNYGVAISAHQLVVIGDGCRIGQDCLILDCDFHDLRPSRRTTSHGESRPIAIGANVWLGARVIVLKGVSIGANTVVAAGSVVTRSLPENVLAAGNPVRVIRPLTDD